MAVFCAVSAQPAAVGGDITVAVSQSDPPRRRGTVATSGGTATVADEKAGPDRRRPHRGRLAVCTLVRMEPGGPGKDGSFVEGRGGADRELARPGDGDGGGAPAGLRCCRGVAGGRAGRPCLPGPDGCVTYQGCSGPRRTCCGPGGMVIRACCGQARAWTGNGPLAMGFREAAGDLLRELAKVSDRIMGRGTRTR